MSIHTKKIKVGSRQSTLAKVQVEEIISMLNDKGITIDFNKVTFSTKGDEEKHVSLVENTIDDFFTDTLDLGLLNHECDIAVHSAKDLPKNLREGLGIFALTESVDETDCFVGNARFNELKANAKIGTSSEVRQNSIKKLKPDVEVVDIRGTIEERLKLVENGTCDGIIVATAALKRLGLEQQIKDIMPWEAVALQGQLAVVGRQDDAELKALFSPIDIRKNYGRVYLVGAGPGDPDLITAKGIKALKQADCVFYDFLAHKDLLNYTHKAERVYVGKRKGAHTLSQEELSKQLRQKVLEGKNIVRLKGGDPLIFGRGAEEIEYLRAYHMNVHVIPGVSSATAIPSSLGVPLTARDVSSSVAFVSGHGKGEKGENTKSVEIPNVDTIVFLMGLTKLDIILNSLDQAGWDKETPMLVISKGTCDDEKIIEGNLSNISQKVSDEKPELPALMVVGETVKFWNQEQYLKGRTLYTGTSPNKFKSLGGVVHLPMIQIEPASLDDCQIKELVDHLYQYHMILLTSRYAVEHFFRILKQKKCDLSELKEKDFIVIGKHTARALSQYHFEPALVADVETSEGLLDAITSQFDMNNKKILFPRSSLPNPFLSDELTKLGAQVKQVSVYQNVKLPKRDLPTSGIDKVLFTSPSTVRNFLQDYQAIPDDWKILSKGPVTQRSLEEEGYESEVVIDD